MSSPHVAGTLPDTQAIRLEGSLLLWDPESGPPLLNSVARRRAAPPVEWLRAGQNTFVLFVVMPFSRRKEQADTRESIGLLFRWAS